MGSRRHGNRLRAKASSDVGTRAEVREIRAALNVSFPLLVFSGCFENHSHVNVNSFLEKREAGREGGGGGLGGGGGEEVVEEEEVGD